jgi:hypothetical protein
MQRRGQVDAEMPFRELPVGARQWVTESKITSEQAFEIIVDGPGILPLYRSIVVGR